MKKPILSLSLLLSGILLLALAQEVNKRLITITYDGGHRSSADLRYGPYEYTHSEPEGLIATVSNLAIYGQNASLAAPEGILISEAEGQREAIFTGNTKVTQGRLEALGTNVVYSEATGLGVMTSSAQVEILIEASVEDEPPAFIQADEATFNVDTDISVSRGNVRLTDGAQFAEADEVTYEEGLGIAVLRKDEGRIVATREDSDGSILTISADEVLRFDTEGDKLLAIGNVVIEDGSIRSSGDMVYFNDEADRAEIIGSPAISEDSANGITLTGQRLEQFIDLDVVRVLDETAEYEWDESDFLLTEER